MTFLFEALVVTLIFFAGVFVSKTFYYDTKIQALTNLLLDKEHENRLLVVENTNLKKELADSITITDAMTDVTHASTAYTTAYIAVAVIFFAVLMLGCTFLIQDTIVKATAASATASINHTTALITALNTDISSSLDTINAAVILNSAPVSADLRIIDCLSRIPYDGGGLGPL